MPPHDMCTCPSKSFLLGQIVKLIRTINYLSQASNRTLPLWFSSSIAFVIDDGDTWGEGERFPLAKMVLNDPNYMLLYQNVLSGCSHGSSVYTVLDLEQSNFSINNYHPVTKTLVRIVVVLKCSLLNFVLL